MTASKSSSQRLAWLEGIRIFAAIMILLYHAQLLITDYAFTPKPTGLTNNLSLITSASDRLGQSQLASIFSAPLWFGFQFVDVFILISGFALVLSLKGKPLNLTTFFKHRFLRVLMPFWTVAWLAYPALWAIGIATDSYRPSAWDIFAGSTFPLLFQFDGGVLLGTSGPWWFMPLILSFTLVFPYLWHLLQRWGAKNLLLVSVVLTLGYRALAVYKFGGHPTYVMVDTPAGWLPFLPFLAKLSTFVVGMVVAQAYRYGRGPVFWRSSHSLLFGVALYSVGFVCQFYKLGWIFADLLLPLGLALCCMVLFQSLSAIRQSEQVMLWLGSYSYSFFLLHNFVVDRTINLVVKEDLLLYYLMLPVMLAGTLILAVLVDHTTPLLKRVVTALLRDLNYVLTINPPAKVRTWIPRVGDRVLYQNENGWIIIKIEQLLDDKDFYRLCQISDGYRTIWLTEDDIQPDQSAQTAERNGRSTLNTSS